MRGSANASWKEHLPGSDHDGARLTEALREERAALLDAGGRGVVAEASPPFRLAAGLDERWPRVGAFGAPRGNTSAMARPALRRWASPRWVRCPDADR